MRVNKFKNHVEQATTTTLGAGERFDPMPAVRGILEQEALIIQEGNGMRLRKVGEFWIARLRQLARKHQELSSPCRVPIIIRVEVKNVRPKFLARVTVW